MNGALDHDIGSISHRSNRFRKIHRQTTSNVRKLLDIPLTHHIFFLSSALEAMERILQNTVMEYCTHFVNGAFSEKWYEFAKQLGKKPMKIPAPYGHGFSFKNAIIPVNTELICITQNETSTGVMIPMNDIYPVKRKNPRTLVALDIVSSAPYPKIDFKKIDMAFFSVQKGFGMPAGMCILIVNDHAIEKSLALSIKTPISTYHNFPTLLKMAEKNQTPETPNVLYIHILGKMCHDMLKKGIVKIRKETDKKAKLLYDFAENSEYFKPFVRDEKFRSPTTIDLELINKTSEEAVNKLKAKGLIVGKGYGTFKNSHIRIANFPAHSTENMKFLINELKCIHR